MSAEGMPPTDESLFARPLAWVTRLAVRHPVTVLAVGMAVALVAAALTISDLGFHTSRLDLLNPESSYNRLWIEYIDEFGDDDDAVVVVDGASRESVVAVLQRVSQALVNDPRLFHAVLHKVDLSKVRAKGLHYLPATELVALDRFLGDVEPIARGQWLRLNLRHMAQGLAGELDPAAGRATSASSRATSAHGADTALGPIAAADREAHEAHRSVAAVEQLAEGLFDALTQAAGYRSPWTQMPSSISTLSELDSEYLLANDGRLGFVLLQLAPGRDGLARGSEAIAALRELIARMRLEHPETRIGLTGLPVMEHDEMQSSQTSMLWATLLSLTGVALLFMAGFGGIRHPLLAVAALLLGMVWSFGYITLAVGHLNILSVSFSVILIGLGIDFGIHYIARYLLLRQATVRCEHALEATAAGTGPAVMTGAVTTAIAFFMAGLTEFTGVAELGIIAGGGVLLCLVAALFGLPAMIALCDRSPRFTQPARPLEVDRWLAPLMKAPRLVLVAGLAGSLVVATGISQLWYDHNLLNLQPEGLESVELERKLLTESDQSLWFALSIAESREELLARKERLLALSSVERTEEIVSLLPADEEFKQPLIRQIHDRLAGLPERPPLIPVDAPEELGRVLAHLQQQVAQLPSGQRAARRLEQVRDVLRRTPLSECYARLSDYQQQTAGDLLSRLHTMYEISEPDPPRFSDLPEGLVRRFVGQHGRHLLKIYPKGNIWDMEALERFVHEVRTVDARATGNPLQTYEASHEMKRSYEQAAVYSLLAIAVVVALDFGSLWHTILALVPLTLGAVQMLGLLGLLGIPLNPANMIVLPLILGIGIDDGVHIVHDFRRQRGRYRLSASTATAVLITSLTTMVGFGSLMISPHRGLQSVGRVLAIGVTCCLITTLVLLPALLTALTARRAELPPDEEIPRHFGGVRPERRRIDRPHPGGDPHSAGEASRRQTTRHSAHHR